MLSPAAKPSQAVVAPIITVSGLAYQYHNAPAPALADINLAIPKGATFGLLGPNGAGKSTLLAVLTGLLPVRIGAVAIAGFDAATASTQIKSISALVPQDYAFYPALSGRENLAFFAGILGLHGPMKRRQLERCIEVCRLQEVLDQRAEFYSGGVKRRLNLAIGLLNAPQILYLDEPTVGIDALSRRCIIEAMHALKQSGTTVIYTSHYMEEVEALCDTVAVIDRGRVVVQDRMENVLQRSGAKSLHLLLQAPLSKAALAALDVYAPSAISPLRWTLQLPTGVAELPAALALLAQQGVAIEQLQLGVSRLEQVYMALLEGRTL